MLTNTLSIFLILYLSLPETLSQSCKSYSYESDPKNIMCQQNHFWKMKPPVTPRADKYPKYITAAVRSMHDDFFVKFFDILIKEAVFSGNRLQSPYTFKNPHEITKTLNLTLDWTGVSHDELLKITSEIIKYSPHSVHPYSLHFRNAGLDPYGIIADWVLMAMNTIMVLYLTSPTYTLMKLEMMKEIRKLSGYDQTSFGNDVGTVVTPFPNGFALQMALQKINPRFKRSGFAGTGFPQYAVFVSEDADHTTLKNAIAQGIGTDGVYAVATDNMGRMDVRALENAISKARRDRRTPLMIVATAGTPILGAIDPIRRIGEIARRNDMWFHVDGECGGNLLFSFDKKHLLNGMDQADSFSFSPACLFSAPIELSFFLVKDRDQLTKNFGLNADYVFKSTFLYNNSYDLGDATIQTCRKPDIFKFWLMWKAKGKNGLESHIQHIFERKDYAVSSLRNHRSFRLIQNDFDLPKVSFYYVPRRFRNGNLNSREAIQAINSAQEAIKNNLLENGYMHLHVATAKHSSSPNFLVISLVNSALTDKDIDYIIERIENVGGHIDYRQERNEEFSPNEMEIDDDYMSSLTPPEGSVPYYVSSPNEYLHTNLFRETANLIRGKGLYFQEERNAPSFNFRNPEQLKLEFSTVLSNEGYNDTGFILDILADVIRLSPHQAHPFFVYQLMAGLDPYALAGDFLVSTLQSASITYEDNPVFTLIENEIFRNVIKQVGWNESTSDGLSVAGGSLSNIYSILLARSWKFSNIKKEGISSVGKKLVYYFSRESHYSFNKGGYFSGIGLDNFVMLKTDARGKIIVSEMIKDIEKTIKDGDIPFYLGATAGTTVMGAFDPIKEMADAAEKYKLWLHVDGAYGGPLIFSKIQKHLFADVVRADSFSMNPTKLLSNPVTCSLIVSRHKDIIKSAFSTNDPTDFSKDTSLYDRAQLDNGDKQFQRVRRSEMVKFWYQWKAKGLSGIQASLDHLIRMRDHFIEETKKWEGFVLWNQHTDATTIPFMYIPQSMLHLDRNSKEFLQLMEYVGFEIQAQLTLQGTMMIVSQHAPGSPRILKMIIMSSGVSKADISYLVKMIHLIGRNMIIKSKMEINDNFALADPEKLNQLYYY